MSVIQIELPAETLAEIRADAIACGIPVEYADAMAECYTQGCNNTLKIAEQQMQDVAIKAMRRGLEAGVERAARAIEAHADEIVPDTRFGLRMSKPRQSMRRNLLDAARVARKVETGPMLDAAAERVR